MSEVADKVHLVTSAKNSGASTVTVFFELREMSPSASSASIFTFLPCKIRSPFGAVILMHPFFASRTIVIASSSLCILPE